MTFIDLYQFLGSSAGILALIIEGRRAFTEKTRSVLVKVEFDKNGSPANLHLENAGNEQISIQEIYLFSNLKDLSDMRPTGEMYFREWLKISPVQFPFPIEAKDLQVFYSFVSSALLQVPARRGGTWFQVKVIDSRGKVWKSKKYPMPTQWTNWAHDNRKFIV